MMSFTQTILLGLVIVTIVFRELEYDRNMSTSVVSQCLHGQKN